MQQYDIDSLVESFAKHTQNFQDQIDKAIASPHKDLDFDYASSFNLSLALLSICKEIQDLKAKV